MKILDVLNSPWAISQPRLLQIQSIMRAHFHGEKIDWKSMVSAAEAQTGKTLPPAGQADKPYLLTGGVAVIDVSGVLTKGLSFFSFLFGGNSMQQIAAAYAAAVADPQVRAVLLAIDSPGGTVDGTQELANLIYNHKNGKPVVAWSDGMMASAAYWIASAADQIYISGDTVEVGSIGVVATHVDYSRADEMMGEKYTEITAGTYKRIASSHAPLSAEGRQTLQDQVDHIYTVFVGNIARNRNISEEQALKAADGRVFIGRQAIEVGLVDGVSTYDRVINSMSSGEAIILVEEENQVMNITELQEKHPEVFQAAVEQGRISAQEALAAQVEAAKTEGISAGAESERKRIRDIQAQAVPGHEAIIEAAIADGVSDAGSVALKIVAAEKILRAQKAADTAADTAALSNVAVASGDETAASGVDPDLPLEERAKAEWDKNPKLRTEFRSYAAYEAFKRADETGKVRILGRK